MKRGCGEDGVILVGLRRRRGNTLVGREVRWCVEDQCLTIKGWDWKVEAGIGCLGRAMYIIWKTYEDGVAVL